MTFSTGHMKRSAVIFAVFACRAATLVAGQAVSAHVGRTRTTGDVRLDTARSTSTPKIPPTNQAYPIDGKAAKQPEVRLQDGLLWVGANGADLSQILGEISQQSGMKVTGNFPNTRVFGEYGPTSAAEVIFELLTGLGVNVMTVGAFSNGAPEELILSPRTAGATPPVSVPKKEEAEYGPGAIAHPKPESDDLPQMRIYQHDRRLQQMHEALEKQEQGVQQ